VLIKLGDDLVPKKPLFSMIINRIPNRAHDSTELV